MSQDTALFEQMARNLYVAVISDMLDGLGLRNQVMRPTVLPIDPAQAPVLVGRAATVVVAPQFEVVATPYTNQIAAIDTLKPDDVVVIATGGNDEIAVWGELFSNAAIARGARGLVTDGCHRDTRMIQQLGFPVFSHGSRPVDISGRGTVVSYGRPVEVAGVRVEQGDIVFAEIDGVAVIPQAVADEVVTRAFEKVAKEDGAREDLRNGALLADVWARYKVL